MDIGFVRVAGAALALAVHEESLQWTRALAAAMKEADEAAAAGLRSRIAAMEEALTKVRVLVWCFWGCGSISSAMGSRT